MDLLFLSQERSIPGDLGLLAVTRAKKASYMKKIYKYPIIYLDMEFSDSFHLFFTQSKKPDIAQHSRQSK